MPAFIPTVTKEDVHRILAREYSVEYHAHIRLLFDKVTQGEKPRIIVACMKNAAGDLQKLEQDLIDSNGYWREIISEAEYPKIKKASKYTQEEIYAQQKEQYLAWFNKK